MKCLNVQNTTTFSKTSVLQPLLPQVQRKIVESFFDNATITATVRSIYAQLPRYLILLI